MNGGQPTPGPLLGPHTPARTNHEWSNVRCCAPLFLRSARDLTCPTPSRPVLYRNSSNAFLIKMNEEVTDRFSREIQMLIPAVSDTELRAARNLFRQLSGAGPKGLESLRQSSTVLKGTDMLKALLDEKLAKDDKDAARIIDGLVGSLMIQPVPESATWSGFKGDRAFVFVSSPLATSQSSARHVAGVQGMLRRLESEANMSDLVVRMTDSVSGVRLVRHSRRSAGEVFNRTFNAKVLVEWLIKSELTSSEIQAVQVGRYLMHRGVILNLYGKTTFAAKSSKKYTYRFSFDTSRRSIVEGPLQMLRTYALGISSWTSCFARLEPKNLLIYRRDGSTLLQHLHNWEVGRVSLSTGPSGKTYEKRYIDIYSIEDVKAENKPLVSFRADTVDAAREWAALYSKHLSSMQNSGKLSEVGMFDDDESLTRSSRAKSAGMPMQANLGQVSFTARKLLFSQRGAIQSLEKDAKQAALGAVSIRRQPVTQDGKGTSNLGDGSTPEGNLPIMWRQASTNVLVHSKLSRPSFSPVKMDDNKSTQKEFLPRRKRGHKRAVSDTGLAELMLDSKLKRMFWKLCHPGIRSDELKEFQQERWKPVSMMAHIMREAWRFYSMDFCSGTSIHIESSNPCEEGFLKEGQAVFRRKPFQLNSIPECFLGMESLQPSGYIHEDLVIRVSEPLAVYVCAREDERMQQLRKLMHSRYLETIVESMEREHFLNYAEDVTGSAVARFLLKNKLAENESDASRTGNVLLQLGIMRARETIDFCSRAMARSKQRLKQQFSASTRSERADSSPKATGRQPQVEGDPLSAHGTTPTESSDGILQSGPTSVSLATSSLLDNTPERGGRLLVEAKTEIRDSAANSEAGTASSLREEATRATDSKSDAKSRVPAESHTEGEAKAGRVSPPPPRVPSRFKHEVVRFASDETRYRLNRDIVAVVRGSKPGLSKRPTLAVEAARKAFYACVDEFYRRRFDNVPCILDNRWASTGRSMVLTVQGKAKFHMSIFRAQLVAGETARIRFRRSSSSKQGEMVTLFVNPATRQKHELRKWLRSRDATQLIESELLNVPSSESQFRQQVILTLYAQMHLRFRFTVVKSLRDLDEEDLALKGSSAAWSNLHGGTRDVVGQVVAKLQQQYEADLRLHGKGKLSGPGAVRKYLMNETRLFRVHKNKVVSRFLHNSFYNSLCERSTGDDFSIQIGLALCSLMITPVRELGDVKLHDRVELMGKRITNPEIWSLLLQLLRKTKPKLRAQITSELTFLMLKQRNIQFLKMQSQHWQRAIVALLPTHIPTLAQMQERKSPAPGVLASKRRCNAKSATSPEVRVTQHVLLILVKALVHSFTTSDLFYIHAMRTIQEIQARFREAPRTALHASRLLLCSLVICLSSTCRSVWGVNAGELPTHAWANLPELSRLLSEYLFFYPMRRVRTEVGDARAGVASSKASQSPAGNVSVSRRPRGANVVVHLQQKIQEERALRMTAERQAEKLRERNESLQEQMVEVNARIEKANRRWFDQLLELKKARDEIAQLRSTIEALGRRDSSTYDVLGARDGSSTGAVTGVQRQAPAAQTEGTLSRTSRTSRHGAPIESREHSLSSSHKPPSMRESIESVGERMERTQSSIDSVSRGTAQFGVAPLLPISVPNIPEYKDTSSPLPSPKPRTSLTPSTSPLRGNKWQRIQIRRRVGSTAAIRKPQSLAGDADRKSLQHRGRQTRVSSEDSAKRAARENEALAKFHGFVPLIETVKVIPNKMSRGQSIKQGLLFDAAKYELGRFGDFSACGVHVDDSCQTMLDIELVRRATSMFQKVVAAVELMDDEDKERHSSSVREVYATYQTFGTFLERMQAFTQDTLGGYPEEHISHVVEAYLTCETAESKKRFVERRLGRLMELKAYLPLFENVEEEPSDGEV